MFENAKEAFKFFSSLGRKTDNVRVKAKDSNENLMQEYRLFDDLLSKKANFNYDTSKTGEEFEKDIESQMWSKYQLNKDEILEYVGFDIEE